MKDDFPVGANIFFEKIEAKDFLYDLTRLKVNSQAAEQTIWFISGSYRGSGLEFYISTKFLIELRDMAETLPNASPTFKFFMDLINYIDSLTKQ